MKAIIIEDEVVIRRGIMQKVSWGKFNITEIFEASDGEMALKIIVQEKPEIILLDINLPKMNGLELLKRVREQNIDSKVLVLSGHDEFSYAQQAIEYGVENYLLKPCSAKKIEEVLDKVYSTISIERERKENYEEMKKKLKDMIPFFRSSLVNSIISSEMTDEEEILRLSSYLGLDLNNEFFIIAVLSMDNKSRYSNDVEVEYIKELILYDLVNEIVDPGKVIFERLMSGKAVLIISGDSEYSTKKYCFSLINRLQERISKEISANITIGIGEVKNSIVQIAQSYSEALLAIENRFIDGSNQVYYIGDITLQNSDTSDYPFEEERKYMQSIKTGQKENSLSSLNKIIDYFNNKRDKYPVALAKIQLKRIAYYLIQVSYELEGNISEIYGEANVYGHIENFSTIDQYEKFITEFTIKLCRYISKKRYVKHTSSIRKAIIFIEENYHDENLNLDRIADYVGMHPNYVSHLFKKEKGESLSSFICKYRVKKAEELIVKNQSLKIYDIAYDVGFSDPNYFATCFKNIIGVSPTEYRQLNVNN